MACYHPIVMYRCRSGRNKDTGKWSLTASPKKGFTDLPVVVPCGRCIGCRLDRSRQWAIRCVHEASLHRDNCFITLTYSPEYIDEKCPFGSLQVKPFQDFMKRLRRYADSIGVKGVRFIHCGEYGEKNGRPHEHAILFGFDFPDKKFLCMRHGFPVWTSEELRRLWPWGLHEIGVCTFKSAAYIARYVVKKITGDGAAAHYCGKKPEYLTMSNRPGIGARFYDRYHGDIFPNGFLVVNNRKCAPPRYYKKLLEKNDPELYKEMYVKLTASESALKRADNVTENLRAEAVKDLALHKLVRPLEGQYLSKVMKGDVIMMMNVYAVYDDKAKSFGTPFYIQTDGMARRLFCDQVQDDNRPSLLHDHPEDFSLYRVGSFDSDSGHVKPEPQPVFLGRGIEFKKDTGTEK